MVAIYVGLVFHSMLPLQSLVYIYNFAARPCFNRSYDYTFSDYWRSILYKIRLVFLIINHL